MAQFGQILALQDDNDSKSMMTESRKSQKITVSLNKL